VKRRRVNVRGLIGATRKKFARSKVHLHNYERELILRDAAELRLKEISVSKVTLAEHFPGRYDPRYIDKALTRLYESGALIDRYRFRSWGRRSYWTYRLPNELRKAA
jgi:hypothetical protein